MKKIEWDDGMSVGVESIDNDHKALIRIISELSDAISAECETSVLHEIFNRLEDYVVEHFKREEALLAELNYPDLEAHINQHRQFSRKIPQLRDRLFGNNSQYIAEQVNLYLYDWLLNHIVNEDLKFASLANQKGRGVLQPKDTPRAFVGDWLRKNIQLSKRILVITLLPFLFSFILVAIFVFEGGEKLRHIERLEYLSRFIPVVTELSHSLQAERGLSAAVISSDGALFRDELIQQRRITDKSLKTYEDSLKTIPSHDLPVLLSGYTPEMEKNIRHLNLMRHQLDANRHHVLESQFYYTRLVTRLHSLLEGVSQLYIDKSLSDHLLALNAVLNMKESLGLKRALGVQAILQERLEHVAYLRYQELDTDFLSSQMLFERFASIEDQKHWLSLYSGVDELEFANREKQLRLAIEGQKFDKLDAKNWFNTVSAYMNNMLKLSSKITEKIQLRNTQLRDEILHQSVFWIIISAILLGCVVMLSWLLRSSIIEPLKAINRAMGFLSVGNYAFRFQEKMANDELKELTQGYENCRRSLLKASIGQVVFQRKQELELSLRLRERNQFEQLSQKDPLTGLLNRRSFDEYSQHELSRAERNREEFCVLMLDIDHFKHINDQYGHAAGDLVLVSFCRLITAQCRDVDIPARLGGEEFAVLLPCTSMTEAVVLAERLRLSVEDMLVRFQKHEIKLKVSIGISQWSPEHPYTIEQLLGQSDQALYQAKQQGRNQVCCYHSNT